MPPSRMGCNITSANQYVYCVFNTCASSLWVVVSNGWLQLDVLLLSWLGVGNTEEHFIIWNHHRSVEED